MQRYASRSYFVYASCDFMCYFGVLFYVSQLYLSMRVVVLYVSLGFYFMHPDRILSMRFVILCLSWISFYASRSYFVYASCDYMCLSWFKCYISRMYFVYASCDFMCLSWFNFIYPDRILYIWTQHPIWISSNPYCFFYLLLLTNKILKDTKRNVDRNKLAYRVHRLISVLMNLKQQNVDLLGIEKIRFLAEQVYFKI